MEYIDKINMTSPDIIRPDFNPLDFLIPPSPRVVYYSKLLEFFAKGGFKPLLLEEIDWTKPGQYSVYQPVLLTPHSIWFADGTDSGDNCPTPMRYDCNYHIGVVRKVKRENRTSMEVICLNAFSPEEPNCYRVWVCPEAQQSFNDSFREG